MDANATAFSCGSTKCNGDIFPIDRLHCLHCAGESCVNAPNNVTIRYPCVNFTDTDSCYSVFSYGKMPSERIVRCSVDNFKNSSSNISTEMAIIWRADRI